MNKWNDEQLKNRTDHKNVNNKINKIKRFGSIKAMNKIKETKNYNSRKTKTWKICYQ